MKKKIKYSSILTALVMLFAVFAINNIAYAQAPDEDTGFDMSMVFAPETDLTVYVNGQYSGALSDSYGFGDTVTLTAPAISGKTFSHWEANGSVISYANPLKLTMNAHTTLYAVYANSAPEKKAAAGFTSITRTNDGESISFQAIAYPNGGTITEAGIVYSTTATGDSLKIDGGDAVTKVEAVKNSDLSNLGESALLPASILDDNNCWMLKFKPEDANTAYHARAYVTVGSDTAYGDVKDVKLSDLVSGISMIANLEGFEPGINDKLSQLEIPVNPGGGGGGGSTPAPTPTYTPVITQPDDGTIAVSPASPVPNDTVTITVTPKEGYEVEKVTVIDADGNPINVTDNGDGTYTFTQPSSGSVTISANVIPRNAITVTFDLNGKEGIAPDTQAIVKDGKATRPVDPTAEGFIFTGWYTDKECTTLYDFDSPVTKSITLYAGWENDNFAIYFAETADDPYEGVSYNEESGRYEIAYTGSAISPLIKVVRGTDGQLTEGLDYTVKYSNNTYVSTKPAVITVSGKGSFADKKTLEFYIIPADLGILKEKGRLAAPDEYGVESGKRFTPVMAYGSYQLKAKDYTLSVTDKITTDTKVSITGRGNFTGSIEDVPVKVLTASEIKTNAIKVAVKAGKHVYNGEPQELSISTAEKTGELTVTAGSSKIPLNESTDFTVYYSGNTDAGNAIVVVTGIGSYNGTVMKTFKIEPDKTYEIKAELSDSGEPVYYTAKGATPDVTVTAAGSNELALGRDYTISYSGNKKVGTGSYTVKFIGNYKGHKALKGTFAIKKAPMDEAEVVTPWMIYKKPGKYLSATYVSVGGVQLKASEYTVKYYEGDVTDVTAEGVKELTSKDKLSLDEGETSKTVTVVVTANEKNFTGTARGTYEVVKPVANAIDLSKAKIVAKNKNAKGKDVNVDKQEYTGEAIEPEIRVLVRQDKQWKEVDPSDYSVTYINNVNKGKAVILINGNGDDTVGSKTVKFSITTMKMSLFKLIFGE